MNEHMMERNLNRKETPETNKEFDVEIEVKVVNLGDKERFIQKILELGGELSHNRRLLRDRNFKLPKGREKAEEKEITISKKAILEPDKFPKAMELLGLTVIGEDENSFRLKTAQLTPRSTRVREQQGRSVFTVKAKREKGQEIDKRAEQEVAVESPEEIENLLREIGYQIHAEAEKYRTTYKFGNVKVELNEGPVPEVPPWAEIEGPTEEEVFSVLEKLGYGKSDTAQISDGDYYVRHGVPKDKIKHLVFENRE